MQVIYNSQYGATEEYAREFARRCGVEAEELDGAQITETIAVVFSPNYANYVAGVKLIEDTELQGKHVALAVVGMTLSNEVRAKDPAARLLGEKAAQVQRFYLPGRLNFSTLKRVHRATLWTMNKMLKTKKDLSPNEQEMLRTYNHDVDRVDFEELIPIEQWARSFAS